MKKLLVTLLVSAAATAVSTHALNIKDFPQPKNAPQEIYAVIEIPQGSSTKYELDAETGFLITDRFQSMPMIYPANYGTLPSSLAGDGDPLDILVYTREAIVPGALVKVRPIGILRMRDAGEQDDKVIAVPADKVDPSYVNIRSINDLPEIERERLISFFSLYKNLPKGRKKVEIEQLADVKEAHKVIMESFVTYAKDKAQ